MRKTVFTLAAAALLAAAPGAEAADRSGTVSATAPSYAWDGGPGTSIGVNAGPAGGLSVGNLVGCFEGIADCEETLIKVDTAGLVTVTANSDDDSEDVLDLYVYPSDAEGTYDDEEPALGADGDATGATESSDEKVAFDAAPGYYVAVVKFFLADADTYKGSAVLSGFAAPVASTPTTTAPQQQQQQPTQQQPAQQQGSGDTKPSRSQRVAACKKKANKKFKGKKKAKKRKAALKKCSKIR